MNLSCNSQSRRWLLLAALCLGVWAAPLGAHAGQVNIGGNISQVDGTYWSGTNVFANVLKTFAFSGGPLTPDGFPTNNSATGLFDYVKGLWPADDKWTLSYEGDAGHFATIAFSSGGHATGFAFAPATCKDGVWTATGSFTDKGSDNLNVKVSYAAGFDTNGNGVAKDPVHNLQLRHAYPGSTPGDLFSQPFLQRMKICSTLRFMQTMLPRHSYWYNCGVYAKFDGSAGNFTRYDNTTIAKDKIIHDDWWHPQTIFLPNPKKNDGGHTGYEAIACGLCFPLTAAAGSAASPATLSYPLQGSDRNFSAKVGKEVRGAADKGTLVYEVWADGQKLYPLKDIDPTTPMHAGEACRPIFLDLTGNNPLLGGKTAQELTLKVYDPDGPGDNDWAGWGSPTLWQCDRWEQRSNPAATYNDDIPIEELIQLCNTTGSDGWFNIPAQADDDYAVNLSNLLLYGEDAGGQVYTAPQAQQPFYPPLHPGLKAYIEYSNEVWASGGANTFCALWDNSPLGTHQGEHIAYTEHVKKLSDIMRPLFFKANHTGQLKIVYSAQTSNAGMFARGLNYLQTHYGAPKEFIDVLAMAPYFGFDPGILPKPPTVEDVLNGLEFGGGHPGSIDGGNGVPAALGMMKDDAAVAQQYGLQVAAYEGGDSIYGNLNAGGRNLAWDAEHATRFGYLYDQYLRGWRQNAADGPFCQYTVIENDGTTKIGDDPTKYGIYFGALDQGNELGSVKYDALCRAGRLAGDCACAGKVTFQDFLTLQANFHMTTPTAAAHWWQSSDAPQWWSQGDFNNDQVVDMADFWLLYQNLSRADQQRPEVQDFIAAHPNPVILPQCWKTPIALTNIGNQGGITTVAAPTPVTLQAPVDTTFGEAPATHSYTFTLLQAPRHGTMTLHYPYLTYTYSDAHGYTGADDCWVYVTDNVTHLPSNKVWIPITIMPPSAGHRTSSNPLAVADAAGDTFAAHGAANGWALFTTPATTSPASMLQAGVATPLRWGTPLAGDTRPGFGDAHTWALNPTGAYFDTGGAQRFLLAYHACQTGALLLNVTINGNLDGLHLDGKSRLALYRNNTLLTEVAVSDDGCYCPSITAFPVTVKADDTLFITTEEQSGGALSPAFQFDATVQWLTADAAGDTAVAHGPVNGWSFYQTLPTNTPAGALAQGTATPLPWGTPRAAAGDNRPGFGDGNTWALNPTGAAFEVSGAQQPLLVYRVGQAGALFVNVQVSGNFEGAHLDGHSQLLLYQNNTVLATVTAAADGKSCPSIPARLLTVKTGDLLIVTCTEQAGGTLRPIFVFDVTAVPGEEK